MYIFFVRKIKETKEWKKIEDQRRWERGNEKEEMRKKDKEKEKQKQKQKKKERERETKTETEAEMMKYKREPVTLFSASSSNVLFCFAFELCGSNIDLQRKL